MSFRIMLKYNKYLKNKLFDFIKIRSNGCCFILNKLIDENNIFMLKKNLNILEKNLTLSHHTLWFITILM